MSDDFKPACAHQWREQPGQFWLCPKCGMTTADRELATGELDEDGVTIIKWEWEGKVAPYVILKSDD